MLKKTEKKVSHTKRIEEAAKRELLRERRQPRERAVHGEEKKGGESKVLPSLREIISMCESKGKLERFFFSRETYTRIIVINLIIVKLFRVCLEIFPFSFFPFKEK